MKAFVLGLGLWVVSAIAPAQAGEWLHGSYPEYGWFRNYSIYLPTETPSQPDLLPMVLFLHGCNQSPGEFADGARLEKFAEDHGVILLLPEQTFVQNSERCWNWFMPMHQGRGAGEAGSLAALVSYAQTRLPVDRNRTYVAGLSAGGVMANTLSSCYPELFAGAAIHSGLTYRSAWDVPSARHALAQGSLVRPEQSAAWAFQCAGYQWKTVPTLLLHGTADTRVAPVNTKQIEEQFLNLADWTDDGFHNGSVKWTETRSTESQVEDGYPYRTEESLADNEIYVKKVMVKGLGHAWSGGDPKFPHTDPKGPDFTQMIAEFFKLKAPGGRR